MLNLKWVSYGLDTPFDCVVITTEGANTQESFNKAVDILKESNVNFDSIKLFDKTFVERVSLNERQKTY